MLHKNLPAGQRHAPHAFEYADAAARTAASGFTDADLYKVALQISPFSWWVLSSISPVTWTATAGDAASVDWADVLDKPETFPPSTHNHDAAYEPKSTSIAKLNAAQTFTAAQRGGVATLTSTSGSIAVDLALANNFAHTTTENSTLAAPSNAAAGQSGVVTITQGGTARTLAYHTFWKFAGGTIPALTASAGAVDALAYQVNPGGTSATCTLIKDIK